jgi:acyl transferase domain-containing protein
MDEMLGPFRAIAEQTRFAAPRVPIISNVTGAPLTTEEATSPEYWVKHVRAAVRFADGVQFLTKRGVTRFLELGPQPTLALLAGRVVNDDLRANGLFTTALEPHRRDGEAFIALLAHAHVHGIRVDWTALFPGGRQRVELPPYAFQRKRYWIDPRRELAPSATLAGPPSTSEPGQPAAASVAPARPKAITLQTVRAQSPRSWGLLLAMK